MAYQKLTIEDLQQGLIERVQNALDTLLEDDEPVDIVTFAEDKRFLGRKLFPRQRLLLKLYYAIPLSKELCWCMQAERMDEDDEIVATPDCTLCHGTGIYDELADVKYLLRAEDKYAKLYFPTICRHHITGDCTNDMCKVMAARHDYRILTDIELKDRLARHAAYLLVTIAGRRSGKSVLGAYVNAYSLYLMLRKSNPQKYWKIEEGQMIGTANVATTSEQAQIIFDNLKNYVSSSPWFKKLKTKPLQDTLEFLGRQTTAYSMHSNSASVRGKTLLAVFLDEFCHFNMTTGKLSDEAMKRALEPSVVTFPDDARVVVTSSPLTKAGTAYNWFHNAEERKGDYINIIAVQMAAWVMNPNINRRSHRVIAGAFASDPDYAEMEYGGQWAESVGQYIPPDAVDACAVDTRSYQRMGKKGIKYSLGVDLSASHDRSVAVITHYDKEIEKVIVDRIDIFDPTDPDNEWMLSDRKEIDHEKVLDWLVSLYKTYKFTFQSITFDQFQSEWILQQARKYFHDSKGDWIIKLTVTDALNREMFSNLRSLIVQGGIEYYKHRELAKELIALSKKQKPSGAWKIEAPPGYHDDIADALAASALMCLVLALNIPSGIRVIKETVEEAARRKVVSPVEGVQHLKTCTEFECSWGCPVPRKLQEQELGIEHLKGCSPSFCVMGCPVQHALLN